MNIMIKIKAVLVGVHTMYKGVRQPMFVGGSVSGEPQRTEFKTKEKAADGSY